MIVSAEEAADMAGRAIAEDRAVFALAVDGGRWECHCFEPPADPERELAFALAALDTSDWHTVAWLAVCVRATVGAATA